MLHRILPLPRNRRSKLFATCSTSQTSLLGGRIRPRAGLLVRAAERVPLRERVPDLLSRGLSLRAQLGEIDAGNNAAVHHDIAVNDNRVDVVAHTALDDALHGIAHRSIAQGISPR